MPPNTLQPTPEELEELRLRRRASQLKGYGEGADDPAAQALLNVRRNLGEAGRAIVGAKPYDETNPTGSYRAVQALMNAPTPAAIIPEAAQAAGKAALALGGLGAATASTLSRSGALPGVAVVKPKGGNWLAGSVERGLEPLRRPLFPGRLPFGSDEHAIAAALGETPEAVMAMADPRSKAINNWIDTKLTKYVKNEMATPEDPVRALAERGTLHFEPQGGAVRSHTMRAVAGMPTEPTAATPLARAWEDVSDAAVMRGQYQDMIPFAESGEEGLRKYGGEYAVKNPQAVAYAFDTGALPSDMGFNHIIDELTNAMNPNSGLPASLRLTPQQLEKVTVPQAVERVAKINEWRAAQKAEADALKARNPATFEHRAYETVPGTTEPNEKGLRWVELRASTEPVDVSSMLIQNAGKYSILEPGQKLSWKDPKTGRVLFDTPEKAAKAYTEHKHYASLEDALKYEGDVMGHCVGGYCPDVIEGHSRIYSLRDKKGEPHVTIEVKSGPRIFDTGTPEGRPGPENIAQIKGKANRAPKDEYLPFVQDFVRSSNWSQVKDLQNTGLVQLPDNRFITKQQFDEGIQRLTGEGEPSVNAEWFKRQMRLDPQWWEEARGAFEGFARGGAVELKDGGHPPIESRRKASDLPGYGEGSTGALGDVVRGFMGEKPADPTNPSELFRLAQALGAFPPVAGVVKGAKGVKSLGEMIDREVRKVRRLEELGKADLNVNIGRPAGPEVTGWHITQDTPGILKTGALTNRDVGAGNIQGYAPAHVGGAYFYSDPQLALAKREDLLEMLGQDPELAAQLPILRAQLRRGNRLLPDEDVGLNVPWQRSFEEGSFATGRPVMLNQVDRIYASDPDVMKDLIRDTAVRQRRYKGGGKVKAPANPNEPEVRGLPDPRLDNLQIYAQTVSREMFPKDAVKRDAARHLIASSILGQKLSPGTSRLLGELYEFKTSPLLHLKSAVGLGAPPPGYEMDKFNNALGSEMQFRNQAELQRGVRQAVDTGRARLTPDEPAPYRQGGAVKIETNPTLMADELLFKGYRR